LHIFSLKKRSDFQIITASGNKAVAKSMIVFVSKNKQPNDIASVRLGFIVSKKNGNAVARNRIKRRLKAVAKKILPSTASMGGTDVVILARKEALERDFKDLSNDLVYTLKKCGYYQK
jgi:ribonuclease P protein component